MNPSVLLLVNLGARQRLESSPVITEPVCEGSYKVRMGVSRAGEDIKEPT